MRMQVRPLALLSVLRIWHCSDCRSQSSSYSSNWTPSLELSMCHGCGPKNQKKKKKTYRRLRAMKYNNELLGNSYCFVLCIHSVKFLEFAYHREARSLVNQSSELTSRTESLKLIPYRL